MGRLLLSLLVIFTVFTEVASERHWRVKRGASDSQRKNWPMPIPYTIKSNFKSAEREIIIKAINSIMATTCVDFKEDTSSGPKLEYVRLFNGGICGSGIGDSRGATTNQAIELSKECSEDMSSVQHETMHALGFQHTQSRSDRDDYLNVNESNIWPNKTKNFAKIESVDYGIPFEYGSRMMYDPYLFNIAYGIPVLTPHDKGYLMSMGTSKSLTFYDFKMINARYKCDASCPEKIDCQNGGYQHPRDCTRCICSDFHEGQHCEIEKGLIELEPGTPYEKVFNNVGDMKIRNKRDWANFNVELHVIKAPEGSRIRITLDTLKSVTIHPVTQGRVWGQPLICDDYGVEIADGDLAFTGKKFCGFDYVNITTYVSNSNVLGYRAFASHTFSFDSKVTFSIESETDGPADN